MYTNFIVDNRTDENHLFKKQSFKDEVTTPQAAMWNKPQYMGVYKPVEYPKILFIHLPLQNIKQKDVTCQDRHVNKFQKSR